MSTQTIVKVILKTNGRCFYCNKPGQEVDHIISKQKWKDLKLDTSPLAGGLNAIDNLVIACKHCNIKKSDSWVEDFTKNDNIWDRIDRLNNRLK